MKKVLLLSIAMSLLVLGYSQSKIPKTNPELLKKSVRIDRIHSDGTESFESTVSIVSNGSKSSVEEHQLGTTIYDWQSNSTVGNRLWRWEDGTIAGVWTMGLETDGGFPDRGTGYNYFDGTSWGAEPTVRPEPARCGWPSITAWGANGEISAAHNTSDDVGCYFIRREVKGTGEWTVIGYDGPDEILKDPTFPKITSSGENNEYTHMLYQPYGLFYQDVENAIVYSRSSDGGESWDIKDVVLDDIGADHYLDWNNDGYMWATNGSVIAFVAGSETQDLVLMKSTDHGENWTKTIVWQHPYPLMDGDTDTDTFFCVDNSLAVAIDKEGLAHVAYGISRVDYDEDGGFSRGVYPFYAGIGYWNETMPTINEDEDNIYALAPPQLEEFAEETEMVEDVNYIGWDQDVDGDGELTYATDDPSVFMNYNTIGLTTQPQLQVDDDGRVIVIWSATTETYAVEELNYKHIWARAYDNGGWGPFMDLTSGIAHWFDECLYPVIANSSDEYFYYTFQADGLPGVSQVSGDHDPNENRIIFGKVGKTDVLSGINNSASSFTSLDVRQNIPNPASSYTNVDVHIVKSANLSIEITNMIGQKVMNISKGVVNSGIHTFSISTDQLDSGVYFYTVYADNKTATKKMIVK